MSHEGKQNQPKKSSIWGKLMKYGLPLIISIGLCYVLFHDMDFGEMVAFINRDCDFTWIFLSMGVGILGFIFRALRWRMQLKASQVNPPVMPVVYSIVGTYAVNLVFPRLGELWRCEYISRRQRASFATVFGSMVAERTSDTITVVCLTVITFFLGGTALKSFVENKFDHSGLLFQLVTSPWTYIIGLAALIIIVLAFRRYRHTALVRKIVGIWHELVGGFMSIFHMHGSWKWFLFTALLWGSYFVQMWMCFRAFGLTDAIMAEHGLIVVLVCFVLGSLSMGVPSNGGIGPYQIAIVFGLECFAATIDKQQAFSFANVVLGAQTLLVIVCGLISFAAIAIDNRRISKAQNI